MEVRQVIDREHQLVAIGALATLIVAGAADAGVVDQQVQPRMHGPHPPGQRLDLVERSQIARVVDRAPRPGPGDLRGDLGTSRLVESVDNHDCAQGAEAPGNRFAEPAGRAGDQGRLALHVDRFLGRGPGGDGPEQDQKATGQGLALRHSGIPRVLVRYQAPMLPDSGRNL
jgi:hypothetical protein